MLARNINLCFRAKKFLEQSYVFHILRFLRNVSLIEDTLVPTMQTRKNEVLGSISPASANPTHCSPVYLSYCIFLCAVGLWYQLFPATFYLLFIMFSHK